MSQEQQRERGWKCNSLHTGSDFRILFNPSLPQRFSFIHRGSWSADLTLGFVHVFRDFHDCLAFKAFQTVQRHGAWAVDSHTGSGTLRVERFVRWVAGISLLHVVLRHIVRPRSSEERKMGGGPMVPRDRRRVHFTKLSLETLIYFSIEREKHIASWNN